MRLLVVLIVLAAIGPAPGPAPAVRGHAPVVAADETGAVLVMPFVDSLREARLHWLSEASSIVVAGEIARFGADVIPREERQRAFERLQLPPTASLTLATMIRMGNLVGASELVVGDCSRDGDVLIARARRIRLDAGQSLGEQVERGPLTDPPAVFERLARRLSGARRDGSGAEGPPSALPDEGTVPVRPLLAAFENYVKGLMAEAPAAQVPFLETALRLDPTYGAARVALWQAWTAQGNHASALAAVEAVPPASPSSAEARFLAALSEISLERLDEAAARLTALGGAVPPGAVLNNLGVAELRKADPGAAARGAYYFSKAAEADPPDADYCFNLGYAYALLRDHKAALYWLRESVRRAPTDGVAHHLLGLVLGSAGAAVEADRERALAQHLGWAEAEPARPSGDAVPRGLERLKPALSGRTGSLIDRALASTGERDHLELAAFHRDRARRLMADARDREAAAELGRAVFLVPYDPEAHLLLGRLHVRNGRIHDGIGALKLAVWCEDTAAGRVALAEAYLLARDEAAARAELARALAIDPASPEAQALARRIGRRP